MADQAKTRQQHESEGDTGREDGAQPLPEVDQWVLERQLDDQAAQENPGRLLAHP